MDSARGASSALRLEPTAPSRMAGTFKSACESLKSPTGHRLLVLLHIPHSLPEYLILPNVGGHPDSSNR